MRLPKFLTKKGKAKVSSGKEKTKKQSSRAEPSSGKKPKVILYSTKTCQWCAKTKEFLKENKIPFTNKDVGSNKKNAQEMIKKSGQQGVPVLDIRGKIIVGYNPSKVKAALDN